MKCLAALLLCVASASLFGQKGAVQTASITVHSKSGMISNSAGAVRPDLSVLLADLERMTAATRYDLSSLQVEKWKSGWQTAWLKSGSRKEEAKQLAVSLKNNLTDAVPVLISETQDSSGGMSPAFKLYNDLSAVVESVGSLEEMAASFGKKDDSTSLHGDYVALGRIRQDLASYIQMTADSLEPVNKTGRPGTVSYGTVLSASKQAPQKLRGTK